MGRISRQRLAVGLSTLLDAIAVALFFVQSAVGDADWIKDEFTAYEFSASVSDLGILNVIKAFVLILIYCVMGLTGLIPITVVSGIVNGAALAKIIAFIVHAVRTKTKLPGLHFVLPIFIMAISWIQVLICRFGRNLDHRYLIEQAEYETSVAGDYASIQDSDYRSLHNKTTPIVPQQRRRYGRETEPLLPPSSLSKSFSVAVVPSVPLVAPALKSYATAAGLDDGGSTATKPNATTERTTLPPASQLAKLMRRSLPTKTHIRSLKQISNAFTQRDVILWLRQTFPNVKLEAPEFATHDLLLALLQMGRITSATQPDAIPSEVDIETSLFTFAIAITEEEEPEDEFA